MNPGAWLGVISDTHGLLRPEAVEALRGAEAILHAGDVGAPDVIPRLERLAPVTAIRGNVDHEDPCRSLPLTAAVEWGRYLIYMVHDREELDIDPAAAGVAAVIYGHSHRPAVELRGGVLYVNPGSAGPRRFRLPVTVARLRPDGDGLDAEIVDLEV